MEISSEKKAQELLAAVRPWFAADQAYLVDTARHDLAARLAVASALLGAGQEETAVPLLQSIAEAPDTGRPEEAGARIRAWMELAQYDMDRLSYDTAEEYLWKARDAYTPEADEELIREDISLMIAQCRFGQGFVQEAIDRAEEILHKLRRFGGTDDRLKERLAKVHQFLGWFYLHKTNAESALSHLRQAMELAPRLDRSLVDAGIRAESEQDYEKAIEHYFDAIQYE
jgi:tetratricopeptide (TPR) repeat protein